MTSPCRFTKHADKQKGPESRSLPGLNSIAVESIAYAIIGRPSYTVRRPEAGAIRQQHAQRTNERTNPLWHESRAEIKPTLVVERGTPGFRNRGDERTAAEQRDVLREVDDVHHAHLNRGIRPECVHDRRHA